MLKYILLCLFSLPAQAQAQAQELLPAGIGLWQVGVRHYTPQTEGYNEDGKKVPIADSMPGTTDTLNQFGLGITASADIDAYIFGMSYGLTPYITVFAGIPFIQANINQQLIYNKNNPETIDKAMANLGYGPLGHLARSGFGDLVVGMRTEYYLLGANVVLEANASIPTGYVKNPDILQDASFGSGYFTFGLGFTPKYTLGDWHIAMPLGYKASPVGYQTLRLPDSASSFSDRSHQKILQIYPGQEYDAALNTGYKIGIVEIEEQIGMTHHFHDVYNGPYIGDFEFLEQGTDKLHEYNLISASVNTAHLFQQGIFPVPFIVELDYFQTLGGYNVVDETYLQVTFTSFFN